MVFLIGNCAYLSAEDLLPSDVYYNENIAVNDIMSAAPTLAGDGELSPGGNGWGGGGWVGSPIGDAVYPILGAILVYGIYMFRRRNLARD